MHPSQPLPAEILRSLLGYLKQADLYRCALVSRSFNATVHDGLIYKSITFRRPAAISQLLLHLVRRPYQARYIEHLLVLIRKFEAKDECHLSSLVYLLSIATNLTYTLTTLPLANGLRKCGLDNLMNLRKLKHLHLYPGNQTGSKRPVLSFDQIYPVLKHCTILRSLSLAGLVGRPSPKVYLANTILPNLHSLGLLHSEDFLAVDLFTVFAALKKPPRQLLISSLPRLTPAGCIRQLRVLGPYLQDLSLRCTFYNTALPSPDPEFLKHFPKLQNAKLCGGSLPREALLNIGSNLSYVELQDCYRLDLGWLVAGLERWAAVRKEEKRLVLLQTKFGTSDQSFLRQFCADRGIAVHFVV